MKRSRIIYYDLKFGIPLADETAENIYSWHFIEHLSPEHAQWLLREAHRVLRVGGILRISVPSLEAAVEEIRQSVEAYDKGDISSVQKYLTSEHLGFVNAMSTHKHMYDFAHIERLLSSIGFKCIVRRSYGQGRIAFVEELDTREDSLFVEAVK